MVAAVADWRARNEVDSEAEAMRRLLTLNAFDERHFSPGRGRLLSCERQRDLLAVHPAYFDLTGGLERWLYRLARKAVPDHAVPAEITFSIAKLHALSTSTRPRRQFAFDLRRIAEGGTLPGYAVEVERRGRQEWVTLSGAAWSRLDEHTAAVWAQKLRSRRYSRRCVARRKSMIMERG